MATLEQYLTARGLSAERAKAVALTAPSVESWGDPVLDRLMSEWRQRSEAARGESEAAAGETIVEAVAVRGACHYRLHGREPETGRFWIVAWVSCPWPGPMARLPDGRQPVSRVILCASKDQQGGGYKWLTLTPHFKTLVGALLEAHEIAPGVWTWVREYDTERNEQPPGETSE